MRLRRRVSILSALFALASVLILGIAAHATPSPSAPGSASGKAVVAGKTLTFKYVWLVRAPNKFDKTKMSSFAVLSATDVSAAIRKCADRNCVAYEALKNGMIIEPSEMGFWAFVAHPELPVDTQFSGPNGGDSGWKTTVMSADRLAGTLRYEDQDRKTSVDLKVDAPFLKEFPLPPPK
jgi:hypothetical protein